MEPKVEFGLADRGAHHLAMRLVIALRAPRDPELEGLQRTFGRDIDEALYADLPAGQAVRAKALQDRAAVVVDADDGAGAAVVANPSAFSEEVGGEDVLIALAVSLGA